MRLLITRPEQDAGALAAALSEHGHSARLEPLIAIVPDPDAVIPDKRYQAVLVTSANGVRALAGNAGFERLQGTPVLAVGRASAEASRRRGLRGSRTRPAICMISCGWWVNTVRLLPGRCFMQPAR